MQKNKSCNRRYYIEFFDYHCWDEKPPHGQWDITCAGCDRGQGFEYKQQAIDECSRLNKELSHETIQTVFGGHRFRVRSRL
jgi:hypothetical protein